MRYFAWLVSFFAIYKTTAAPYYCQEPESWGTKGWAATLFSGPLTAQNTTQMIQKGDFGRSGIIAFAVSKELSQFWKTRLGVELETQAVQHFGKQTHFEFNPITLIVRWKSFPWNNTLPTTFAIGDGISIATKKAKQEVKKRGKETAHTLNYVMAEMTFSSVCLPKWAFVLRYHHRSGMFGTFHGVHDASTAFAAGVKHWF